MVKQLRLMYKAPFTEEEREQYRPIVFANTLQSIQVRPSPVRSPFLN